MSRLVIHTTETLVGEVREISQEDLEALTVMGPGVDGHAGTLRVRHHRIAQLAAAGMKNVEIAEVLGISGVSVSTLLSSPAFQGLIQEYLLSGWSEIEAVTRRARLAASSGVEELHRRIETAGKSISTRDLTTTTLGLLDRGGIAQRHAHVHFGLSSSDVAEILKGALEIDDSRVVEAVEDGQGSSVLGTSRLRAVRGSEGSDSSSEGWAEVREISPSGA